VVARGNLDGEHGPGSLLGAAAALDAAAPAPPARATEASTVLELGQDDFIDVLAEHPTAARALARSFARTLRESRK
jgi:CRP-like cAMP-binding protein